MEREELVAGEVFRGDSVRYTVLKIDFVAAGTGLSIIQEAGLYSQQLWAVAGKGQGLLPITKRLTVERVEGSAVARVSQPSSDEEVEDVEEEEKEDWPRMEVEPEAKRVKKSEKKEKKGKKEKKEKKKDKNRED